MLYLSNMAMLCLSNKTEKRDVFPRDLMVQAGLRLLLPDRRNLGASEVFLRTQCVRDQSQVRRAWQRDCSSCTLSSKYSAKGNENVRACGLTIVALVCHLTIVDVQYDELQRWAVMKHFPK